jgi:hypothetical protein
MATDTYRALQRIQQGRAVIAVLGRVTQRLAEAARAEAAADRITPEISTSSGRRPQGRSYGRVSMVPGSHEFGDSKTRRRRILARAVARR